MARLWSCGFELQSVTSGVEWDTTTNSPTISTTIKRSGAAALRCNPSATTALLTYEFNIDGGSAVDLYFRAYVYITTATDALDSIMRVRSTANEATASIRMNSDRTLELWDDDDGSSPVQIGSDSSALNTGQWYRIEMAIVTDASGFPTSATGYIDGVQFATGGAFNFVGAAPGDFQLGAITATTCDLYFDDVAINNNSGASQTGLPGAGSIVHMQPDSAGDSNTGFSGDWSDLDEVTPDDGTTIVILDNDNELIDVNCESSSNAGIGSTDTISLVLVGIREAASSGALGANGWNVRIKSASGASVQSGSTTTHNDTTYQTNGDVQPRIYTLASYTDPTTGVAWTPTGTNSLDNMQIGVIATDANPDVRVSTLWASVEYVPASAAAASIIPTLLLMGAA